MKLKFTINENYLIAHTLSSTSRFSSKKYQKDIVAFQNFAWKKSRKCYNLLIGGSRLYPEDLSISNLQSIVKELPKFFETLRKSKQYEKILSQTEKYLEFCKKQWNKNYPETLVALEKLTGLKFKKSFTVYITHPSLRNGRNLGSDKIAWGHCEEWPNYVTVYLWHEALHSYFGRTDLEHALIEFLTDEELRIKLNGGKYPPFAGHENLSSLKQRILPDWKRYLKNSQKRDIKKFQKRVVR